MVIEKPQVCLHWVFIVKCKTFKVLHCGKKKCVWYLSAIVCCSLMPTLNSTGNTRRGLPFLISSGKLWKTSRGNGTSTVKWSLNAGRERKKKQRNSECFTVLHIWYVWEVEQHDTYDKGWRESLLCAHSPVSLIKFVRQITSQHIYMEGICLVTVEPRVRIKLLWPCCRKYTWSITLLLSQVAVE